MYKDKLGIKLAHSTESEVGASPKFRSLGLFAAHFMCRKILMPSHAPQFYGSTRVAIA